jgi:hypothetical protein
VEETSPLVEALAGRAWNDALEVAAKVAERRTQAGRSDTIPDAIRALIFNAT